MPATTLLLVGGPDPDDTTGEHDVQPFLWEHLSAVYRLVHVPDVNRARAWCQANFDTPVLIAYTADAARTWEGAPNPLARHGHEVMVTVRAPGLVEWDLAEHIGADSILPLGVADGWQQLNTRLAKTVPARL